jgi:inner membrane protein
MVDAFFGILPGFEAILAGLLDTARELAAERGASHSLVLMALGSWGMAQGLAKIWAREKITKGQAGAFVFGVWAVHVLVDCFSVEGAALFWPISQKRVAFGFLNSGDWFFTIPLVLAVLCLVIYKEPAVKKTRGKAAAPPSRRRRRFYWGVGASLLYALAGLALKFWVSAGFEQDLTRRGSQYQRQMESPAHFNVFLWRSVVDRGDQLWVGYRSVFEMPSTPVRWTVYPKGDPALAGLANLRETKTLMAVTDGWWLARPHAKGAWVGDLRLPEFRTWGSKKGMVDSRLADSWVVDPKSQGDRLRRSYMDQVGAGDYVKRMLARTVGKRESWEANPRLAGVPSLPEFLSVEE